MTLNIHDHLNVTGISLGLDPGTSRAQAQLEKSDHFSAKSFPAAYKLASAKIQAKSRAWEYRALDNDLKTTFTHLQGIS